MIALHRNSVDLANQELRHHGIYIDVAQMLTHEPFLSRLRGEIAQLNIQPTLIVTPPHRAGKLLSERIADLLAATDDRPDIVVHPDLRVPPSHISAKLNGASVESTIFIVDDVSATGDRLSRYQQSLRELQYRGRIVYFVAVARPDVETRWNRLVTELRFRSNSTAKHDVICIEKVIVPDWDYKTCPWCAETRSLTNLVGQARPQGEARERTIQRTTMLERARITSGLIDDAVRHVEGEQSLRLTPNSLFIHDEDGSSTEADVIASVAAAMQQMRTAKLEEKRLDFTYPHVSVLNTENYFGIRFNDDILRLAILRCATSSELERWNDREEERRKHLVGEYMRRLNNRGVFNRELAIARLGNKIPQPHFAVADMTTWCKDLWEAFRT